MATSTKMIAGALLVLAGEIQSPDDVPAACLREAAKRLEEQNADLQTMTGVFRSLEGNLREATGWYRSPLEDFPGLIENMLSDYADLQVRFEHAMDVAGSMRMQVRDAESWDKLMNIFLDLNPVDAKTDA